MPLRLFSTADGCPTRARSTVAFGLWYATRPARTGGPCFVGAAEDVESAVAHGAVGLHTPVRLRVDGQLIVTSVGRVLLWQALGPSVALAEMNRTMNASVRARLLARCADRDGVVEAERLARRLDAFGLAVATASFSMGMDDIGPPPCTAQLLEHAHTRADDARRTYEEGLYTSGEHRCREWEAFRSAEEEIERELDRASIEAPVGALIASGLCTVEEARRTVALVGAVAPPRGESLVRRSLTAGLPPHAWAVTSEHERRRSVDAERRRVVVDRLHHQLVDAIGHLRVTERDCGNATGRVSTASTDAARIIATAGERALGRTAVEPVLASDGTLIAPGGDVVNGEVSAAIDERLARVEVRSLLACRAPGGVCSACYGWDLAERGPAPLGARVGLHAARSIAESARVLNEPLFVIGGQFVSPRSRRSTCVEGAGTARWESIDAARIVDGENEHAHIALREGRVTLVDDEDAVLERFRVQSGDVVEVLDGARVERGAAVVSQHLYGRAVVADVPPGASAVARWVDVQLRLDELRDIGGIALAITEADGTYREQHIRMPANAWVLVKDGACVARGEVVALLRGSADHGQVYGGWSDLLTVLGARRVRDAAVVAEHDGVVRIPDPRFIEVHADDGRVQRRRARAGSPPIVYDGERVRAGDALTHGQRRARDLLRAWGRERLAEHLFGQLAPTFAASRVRIADVHLELVVRAMLDWSRVDGRTVPRALAPAATPAVLGIGTMARRARR